MSEDHTDLAICLNNLENKLSHQYKYTEKMKILKKMIQMTQQTINVMPENYLNLTERLNSFEVMLKT